jgi:hypothetical protein
MVPQWRGGAWVKERAIIAPDARRTCEVAGLARPDIAMSAAAMAAQHPARTIVRVVSTLRLPRTRLSTRHAMRENAQVAGFCARGYGDVAAATRPVLPQGHAGRMRSDVDLC